MVKAGGFAVVVFLFSFVILPDINKCREKEKRHEQK